MNDTANNNEPITIIKECDKAYYFSHETITKYEAGQIKFADKNGSELSPRYFGSGLTGMNGTLSHKKSD